MPAEAAVSDESKLVVSLEARIQSFERALAKATGAAVQSTTRMRSAFDRAEARVSAFDQAATAAAGRLGGAFNALGAAIAGAFSAREIGQAVETFTRAQNALKVAGLEGERLTSTFNDLVKAAQANGAPIEALTGLYSKAAQAADKLKASDEDLIKFSDGVATALRASGTSASQASGALLQLGQALNGGIVRAEEYNSILEGAPQILKAVAVGLKEAGGDIGKLRQIMEAGKLSSRAFFAAFLAGQPAIAAAANRAVPTLSQALQKLENSFVVAVGKFDAMSGTTRSLTENLGSLSGMLDRLPGRIEAAGSAWDRYKKAANDALKPSPSTGADDFGRNLEAGLVPTRAPVKADLPGLEAAAARAQREIAKIEAAIKRVQAAPLLPIETMAQRQKELDDYNADLKAAVVNWREIAAAIAEAKVPGSGWNPGREESIGRGMSNLSAQVSPVSLDGGNPYAALTQAAEEAARQRALLAEKEAQAYRASLSAIQRAYLDFYDQQIKGAQEAGVEITDTIRRSAEAAALLKTQTAFGVSSAGQLRSQLGGVVDLVRGASAGPLAESLGAAAFSASQLQDRIGALQDQLNDARDAMTSALRLPDVAGLALGKDSLAALDQARAKISALVADQQAGTLAFETFRAKLQAVGQEMLGLGVAQNVVDPFIADVVAATQNLSNLSTRLEAVRGRLTAVQQASAAAGTALSGSFSRQTFDVPGGTVNVTRGAPGSAMGTPPLSPATIAEGLRGAAPAITGPIASELQRLGLLFDSSGMRVENAVRTGPPSLSSIEGNTAGTRDAITATGDQTVSALNTGFMGTQAAIGEIGSVLATSGSGSGGGSDGDQWTIALPSLGDQLTAEYEMRMGNLQQRMQGLQIELMEAQLKGNEALVASIQRQIQELQLVIAKAEFAKPTRFNTPGWFNPAGPSAVGGGGLLSLGTGKGKGGGGGFGGFGFATGGAFRVGGIGGRDSQMVSFKASPNETVKIETPAQRRKSEGGGKGDVIINMNAPVEERRRRARRQAAREIARAIDGVR